MKIGGQEIKGMGSWNFDDYDHSDFLDSLPKPTETISFTAKYPEAALDFLTLIGKPIKIYPDPDDETVFYEGVVKEVIKTEDGYDWIIKEN